MIKKIVLTGGPSSGKTTIIKKLRENLEGQGYNVICISETASELINAHFIPYGKTEYVLKFQELVLKQQSSKEKNYEKMVEDTSNKDTIIIYDRAILDNRAYLDNQKDFDYLLGKNSLSEITISDKYDLVIDLVTAANLGKDEYEENGIRYEDIEGAKKTDIKTTIAWLLAPNLIVVKPEKNFENKVNKVIHIVNNHLKGGELQEKVSYPLDEEQTDLSMYNDDNSKKVYITDYHLANINPYTSNKVTKREYKGYDSYVYKSVETSDDKKQTNKYLIDALRFNELINSNWVLCENNYTELNFINDNQDIFKIVYKDNEDAKLICNRDSEIPKNVIIKKK